MLRHLTFSLLFIAVFTVGTLQAQETEEIKRLTDKIALLEEKLEIAKKKNELLQMEIELLKTKPSAKEKEGGKKTTSDLLPVGAVLTGTWRSLKKPNKDGNFGNGSIAITITDRDGGKFKADCVINNAIGTSSTSSIQGVISGAKLYWETVGNASQIKAGLIRKGEDALEGTYQIPTTGDAGTVGLKLPKVGN